jgi:hypothetical protein
MDAGVHFSHIVDIPADILPRIISEPRSAVALAATCKRFNASVRRDYFKLRSRGLRIKSLYYSIDTQHHGYSHRYNYSKFMIHSGIDRSFILTPDLGWTRYTKLPEDAKFYVFYGGDCRPGDRIVYPDDPDDGGYFATCPVNSDDERDHSVIYEDVGTSFVVYRPINFCGYADAVSLLKIECIHFTHHNI